MPADECNRIFGQKLCRQHGFHCAIFRKPLSEIGYLTCEYHSSDIRNSFVCWQFIKRTKGWCAPFERTHFRFCNSDYTLLKMCSIVSMIYISLQILETDYISVDCNLHISEQINPALYRNIIIDFF